MLNGTDSSPLAVMQRAMHWSSQFVSVGGQGSVLLFISWDDMVSSIISTQQSFTAGKKSVCASAMPLLKIANITSSETSNRNFLVRMMKRFVCMTISMLRLKQQSSSLKSTLTVEL